jgi:hypothetical protein
MSKTNRLDGLGGNNSWIVSILVVACGVFFGTTALAQEIKPRILILFDTSGSMTRDIGVYDPELEENVANSTNGDGSTDEWAPDGKCCPGAGGSRMFIAKEAMREMILATGDIDFALMKFPQNYVEDLGSCADHTDPDLLEIYGSQCAAKEYKYNQGTLKDFDLLRYYLTTTDDKPGVDTDCDFVKDFTAGNQANWLCEEFEEFNPDSSAQIVAWMDHKEFNSDGTARTSPYTEPHADDSTEQELRAEGVTPLGEAIKGAYDYLVEVVGGAEPDLYAGCRPYILVILTDGDPELPKMCVDNGWASPLDPVPQVANMNPIPGLVKPVKTYVIGLAHQSATLNAMAAEGGTGRDTAYKAESKADLSAILVEIINDSLLHEDCNYLDDDCDGLTDEDFRIPVSVPVAENMLETFCDPTDWVANVYCNGGACGAVCDPSDPLYDAVECPVPTGTAEEIFCVRPPEMACDGIDDNCDGVTDEDDSANNWTTDETWRTDDDQLGDACGGGPVVGNEDYGQCERGILYCAPGDGWLCGGEIGPSAEVCDGNDNDCDNETDEDIPEGAECSTYVNQTCINGHMQCVGGGMTCVEDDPSPIAPFDEICNGLDDDCDGETDENLLDWCGGCDPSFTQCEQTTPTKATRDVGECVAGNSLCDFVSGDPSDAINWTSCVGSVPPGTETCDDKDNNCDGVTDEGLDGAPCGPPCNDGEWQCISGDMECVDFTSPPPAEVCDGADNDCDGETDEGLIGPSCGLGLVPPGTLGICGKGNERCVDDGAGTKVTQCCVDTSTGDTTGTCIPPQGPLTEVCNGLDDDCDGDVDSDDVDLPAGAACSNAPSGNPAGVGICIPGVDVCVNGQWVCNGPQPETEECDGEDDDCDGVTDNNPALGAAQNHTGSPYFLALGQCNLNTNTTDPTEGECLPGTYVCQASAWWCVGGRGPGDETCNDLDDDCDGSTDDSLANLGACGLGPVGDGTEGICEPGNLMCVTADEAKVILCCVDTSTGGPDGTCNVPRGPRLETCNGKNDDCDWELDEDLYRDCNELPGGGTVDEGMVGEGNCHLGNQPCDTVLDSGVEDWGDCVGAQGPD